MTDLKVLAPHPVQYHVPLYQLLAKAGLDIEVAYYHAGTALQTAHDPGFGIEFKWDVDLLSGYSHRFFLRNSASYSRTEQLRTAWSLITWSLSHPTTPLLLIGWFMETVWLVWLLRILCHAPTMILCETTLLNYYAWPKPKWRSRMLKWLLRHTSAGLYIGERNRSFLREMGMTESQLFSAPYSVDNERFRTEAARLLPERSELCRQFNLDPCMPTFLFCGKLQPVKNPLALLEAYLNAGLKDCAQLVYVGDGELRSAIEQRVKETEAHHVHILGFLNQTQMPLAYVLGEALCLVSEMETWGLVVNEALACGRAVIVTDTVGCAPDLVTPENGWTVPLADPAALAYTLREAYQRRVEWLAMGCAGQALVASHTFTRMAAGIETAVKQIRL